MAFCPGCERLLRAQSEAAHSFAETGESLSQSVSRGCDGGTFEALWSTCTLAREECVRLRSELAEHLASHET